MTSALAIVRPIEQSATVRAPAVRPAPVREPPFDDEIVAPALQLATGYDRELPFAEALPPTLASVSVRRGNLPDPATWTRRLLLGLAETAAGRRPLSQVAALLSPSVARGLGADFERASALGTRHWLGLASVRNVHVTEPKDGVAELAATVNAGTRVRAVALRLEERHGQWRCTRLQIG